MTRDTYNQRVAALRAAGIPHPTTAQIIVSGAVLTGAAEPITEVRAEPELPEFDAGCNVCGRLVQLRKLTGWQWAHTTLSHVPDHLAVPTHVRLASQPWPNLDTGDTIARLAEDRRNRASQ